MAAQYTRLVALWQTTDCPFGPRDDTACSGCPDPSAADASGGRPRQPDGTPSLPAHARNATQTSGGKRGEWLPARMKVRAADANRPVPIAARQPASASSTWPQPPWPAPGSPPHARPRSTGPKLLAGVATKGEAGFAVAVPGSDTFQLFGFLGLAT